MNELDLPEIARIEEQRQAIGTGEVALESEPIAGGVMAFTAPGSWSNQACGLGLDAPVSDDDLDRLVDFYVSRAVEPKIEVCPFADESLTLGLAKRGFTLREFVNTLARPLPAGEDLRASMPFGWPDGLEVRLVDPGDDEIVRQYVDVSGSGFRDPGEKVEDHFIELSTRVVRHPRSDSFLAFVDGHVAAGGGMETSDPIRGRRGACLFGASVLPEFRRRGIQQALMVARMERARQRHAELVCIQSKPAIPTERNALRLGFTLAYTKAILAMAGQGLSPSP